MNTTGNGATGPRIVLYGRAGCHLCEEARAVVADVSAHTGVAWREVDVDDDPGLTEQYGEYVPVVTVDGVQHGFWRLDPLRLRRAVTQAPGAEPARRSG